MNTEVDLSRGYDLIEKWGRFDARLLSRKVVPTLALAFGYADVESIESSRELGERDLILAIRCMTVERLIRDYLPMHYRRDSPIALGKLADVIQLNYRTELPRDLVVRIEEGWRDDQARRDFGRILSRFAEIRNYAVHGGEISTDEFNFIVPEQQWIGQRPPIILESVYSLISDLLHALSGRAEPLKVKMKSPRPA